MEIAGVFREVFESAVSMGRAALRALGIEEAEVKRIERGFRERDQERLASQVASGDLRSDAGRMFVPGRPLQDDEAAPLAETRGGECG